MVDRAQGCLLGQLTGDALGSQVEFMSAPEIERKYPSGVRELRDGGTWNTLAGQPTDDSEMALLLARMLVRNGRYTGEAAFREYRRWIHSDPYDVGFTIRAALQGEPNSQSQANGAMMRVSPLGIFGAGRTDAEVCQIASEDAVLTHPNRACVEANALYTMAIAQAVRQKTAPAKLYRKICVQAAEMGYREDVQEWIARAEHEPPESFERNAGWVKIAFGNALYQMLHGTSFEQALVATVGCGGDSDTNAAIAGALLGAVHGLDAVPKQWVEAVLSCRPRYGLSGVKRPRPEVFWPVDAMELARKLLEAGSSR